MDDNKFIEEFSKVKNYPSLSRLLASIILIAGMVISFILKMPFLIFPFGFISGFTIYHMAKKYKCPNCNAFLWNVKDKKNMKNCPKCKVEIQK